MKKALIFLAVAAVCVGLIWLLIPPDAPPPAGPPAAPAPRLTVDELKSLVQQKNLALAQLENGKLSASSAAFEELADDWPGELVAVQNLAVSRLMQIDETTSPADRLAAISRTRMAVLRLLELAPDNEVPHVLAGRLAILDDDPDAALREFAAAAAINPDSASTWYEFRNVWNEFDDTVPEEIHDALQQAFELAPDNLWVLRDWWTVQVMRQDPTIVQTLQTLRPILEQYAERIQEMNRIDVLDLLTQAEAQAAANDWESLRVTLIFLWRGIYADDAAHSDRLHINRHPLEFVITDFSEAFYEDAPPLPAPEEPNGTLAFQPLGATFTGIKTGVIRDGVLEDFDLDGRLEVCLLQEASVTILQPSADSREWSPLCSIDVPGGWSGMLLVDIDDDRAVPVSETLTDGESESAVHCHLADLDVVLFGPSGLQVLLNEKDASSGRRSLTPVDIFGDAPSPAPVQLCRALDGDMDGDLDLLLSNEQGLQFLSNRGNTSFRLRENSILGLPDGTVVNSALPVDFDRDNDIDLLVTTEGGSLGMLENLRHGNFRWQPLPEWQMPGHSVSAIDVIEADGNVSWDLLAGSRSELVLQQTRTPQRGTVQLVRTNQLDVESPSLVVADFDNDSLDEVLCWSDHRITLINCALDGSLTAVDGVSFEPSEDSPIVVADYGDLDGDGDLDAAVFTENSVQLFENALDPVSDWIDVQLVAEQAEENQGVSSGRVNHVGLGSLVEMKVGGAFRARIVRRPRTHFGLDSLGPPDVLRVVWTNGVPQNLLQPERNQIICEVQTLSGSCPYLYAWNGVRHEFVTDLCWAAPLGLPAPQGGLMPHRDWEYIRINGNLLAEDNGVYRLQITEELWEAAYFDQIQLLAIDHPADVSVFSNEKVGPPEIAHYGIHTVREPRPPVAARDQHGRDVLADILAADDVYLRLHEKKITQGYTDPTLLELDLGQLDDPQRITLFLTGWVFPTDAAINTALAENPDLPGPRPPAIQVPDASGEWIEAIPYMGFPGGKTKTIAVDISGIFPTDDYRLRIVTGMELFWDHVFFTVDESPAEIVEHELTLVSADLHFRGVSEFTIHPHNGPDRYHYDHVTPAPRFAPMAGAFTRFGDVRELITHPDDRLLVMGCGDECTLEFAVPADPLPDGWTRDFILHTIGWDKDANLNTVYGQTVEPMPYRNMQSYPYPPDSFPGGPGYDEYLRTYQTRTFVDSYFRRALQ